RRRWWPLPIGGGFAAAAMSAVLLMAVPGLIPVRTGHGRSPGQPAHSVVTVPPSRLLTPQSRSVLQPLLNDRGPRIATQEIVLPRPQGEDSPPFWSSTTGAGGSAGVRTGGPHSGNLYALFSGSHKPVP